MPGSLEQRLVVLRSQVRDEKPRSAQVEISRTNALQEGGKHARPSGDENAVVGHGLGEVERVSMPEGFVMSVLSKR
jgi:hypothetical protein